MLLHVKMGNAQGGMNNSSGMYFFKPYLNIN